MKTASAALQTFLGANKNFAMADLWQFNLKNGFNFYWTDADINLFLLSSCTRASFGTYLDDTGTLRTAADNIARYNYLYNPLTGVGIYQGILQENAATNLCLYSEAISNWNANNSAVVIDNAAVAPSGVMTASTISGSITDSGVYEFNTVTASTVYTQSLFVKSISGAADLVIGSDSSLTGGNAVTLFNALTGAISAGTAVTNYSVVQLPNGWWRVSLTYKTAAAQTSISAIAYRATSSAGVFSIWGSQLESGLFSTSYIKTIASTANRAADVISGKDYLSHQIILKSGKFKQIRGLEVNECDLVCYDYGLQSGNPMLVGQTPFLQAVRQGMFDRAVVNRYRIFMTNNSNGQANWGDTSLGTVLLFTGEVTDVEVTRNMATLKCKDATNLLNIYMPRRQYQPSCPWTFGDSNCTFNRTSLTVSTVVSAGSSGTTINAVTLTQGAGYFNYGVVAFTSGVNQGISRTIKSYSNGEIILSGPFPNPPQTGDMFTITPGCSKQLSASSAFTQQFNASVNTVPSDGTATYMIYTVLPMAAGFFNGGTLQFTSGANVGEVRTITSFANGVFTVSSAFLNVPAVGDELSATSSGSNTANTCTGYNNTQNYGGQNGIPVPETAY
jgi:uncharacterized phage protein (TIGR02218 family)